MLKVNEEKLLQDREYLLETQKANLAKIHADAKAFATAQGYDEKTTNEFIEFVTLKSNSGLSVDEYAKLAILNLYVEEVPDKVEKELEATSETVVGDPAVRLNVV